MKDFGWCRAAEACRVRRPGDGQGREAVGGLGCCQAVVDVGRAVQADAGMAVFVVVPLNIISQEASSVGQGAETLGEGRGAYFKVLNQASEYGLSLETLGRECDLVTSKSDSSAATVLDVIDVPRTVWKIAPGTRRSLRAARRIAVLIRGVL